MKLTIFLFGICLACSTPGNEQSQHEQDSPLIAKGEKNAVAAWVKRNLDIELKDSVFVAAGITDTLFFSTDISAENKELLFDPFFLGEKTVNEITTGKGVITVDLSSDTEEKSLFITNEYVIVGCHLVAGNNGRSLIYDLKKQTAEPLNMTVSKVLGPHRVEAWFDYYEKNGHVWETGTYDIPAKQFRRTSIER